MQTRPILRTASAWLGTLGLAALTACGGGRMDDEPMGKTSSEPQVQAAQAAAAVSVPSAKTIVLQQEGARLNTAELEDIAKTGVLPQPFDGPLLSGAEPAETKSLGTQKSAASRVPVFRFFNAGTGAHFFTISTTERDNIVATLPAFSYEGVAFYTSNTAIPGLSPVHRFFNAGTGVHFYTISESERAMVAASLPQFRYEGIAYYASTLPGTGFTPLYRFFYAARGFHFYTSSQSERDNIIATLPQYSHEGVGYYTLTEEWMPPAVPPVPPPSTVNGAVPHTGFNNSRCYQPGTNTLTPCDSAGVLAFNPQQDGHRQGVHPMSYSFVPVGAVGGGLLVLIHPLTSCVRDNVTGLVWEGKEAAGARAESRTFTLYDDPTLAQVSVGSSARVPTPAEIAAPTNAMGYVAQVNALGLCGFSDWRLPTWSELLGLVDFSAGGVGGLAMNAAWFGSTTGSEYWSASSTSRPSNGLYVGFSTGETGDGMRSSPRRVRLVRGGAPAVSTTFLYSYVGFGSGEAANNVAFDRVTGLQWRRCALGQYWRNNTCEGTAERFSHEEALRITGSIGGALPGWRLPNVKELASIARPGPGDAFDPVAFPATDPHPLGYWSSTPSAFPGYALKVSFATAKVFGGARISGVSGMGDPAAIRLVRSVP